MRKYLFILLVLLLFTITADAQQRCVFARRKVGDWSWIVNAGIASAKPKLEMSKDKYSDRFSGGLNFGGDIGARFNIKDFYMQATLGYARYDNKYELPRTTIPESYPNQVLQTISLPIILGLNYKNDSRIFPLMEVGVVLNYALDIQNSDIEIETNKVFPAITGRLGLGYEISDRFALEFKAVYTQTSDIAAQSLKYTYKTIGGQISFVCKLE